jgi:hypothetical protein
MADASSMEPLQGFANFGAHELARLALSSERSARRWIAEGFAPRLVVRFLEIVVRGPLGLICERWNGWSLRGGVLHAPTGATFTPEEIAAIPLRLQQIAELERSVATLRARGSDPVANDGRKQRCERVNRRTESRRRIESTEEIVRRLVREEIAAREEIDAGPNRRHDEPDDYTFAD